MKVLMPSIAGIVLAVVALTFFRLRYFGYPLPNTYYAKVAPSLAYNLEQGVLYLVRYFISDAIALISVTAVFAAILYTIFEFRRKKIPDMPFFLPLIGGMGLFLPLLTGGDHFGSFRLYQNIYPIIILSLFCFVNHMLSGSGNSVFHFYRRWKPVFIRATLIPCIVLVFFLNQGYAWSRIESEMRTEFQVAAYQRKTGTFIRELFSNLPKLPSVGVIASGGIKYSYDGEIIDLMGLNNTIMAHNLGDRTGFKNHAAFEVVTFYKLKPDIVWPKEIDENNWAYLQTEVKDGWENTQGFKGLFDDADFLEFYTYAKVSRATASENRYALVAWFKKDFLNQLSANADFRVEIYQYLPDHSSPINNLIFPRGF